MKARAVEVTPIPAGNAALLRVGMWSLAVSDEELGLLVVAAMEAARVLGLAGSGMPKTSSKGTATGASQPLST